jgi:hypothetical protein
VLAVTPSPADDALGDAGDDPAQAAGLVLRMVRGLGDDTPVKGSAGVTPAARTAPHDMGRSRRRTVMNTGHHKGRNPSLARAVTKRRSSPARDVTTQEPAKLSLHHTQRPKRSPARAVVNAEAVGWQACSPVPPP